MKSGSFCFLTDQYYIDFPDDKLMKNKETTNGILHNRPCFFAFPDTQIQDVLWLVPVSSKVEKYKIHYDRKVEKYGYCNNICFGVVAGSESAFLIQNMCPATEKYINNIYVDKNNLQIQVDDRTVDLVVKKARKALSDYFRGHAGTIFPDIKTIKRALVVQCQEKETV